MLDLFVNVRLDAFHPFVRRGKFLEGSFGPRLQGFQENDAILWKRLNRRPFRQCSFCVDEVVPGIPGSDQVFMPFLFRHELQATLTNIFLFSIDLR